MDANDDIACCGDGFIARDIAADEGAVHWVYLGERRADILGEFFKRFSR